MRFIFPFNIIDYWIRPKVLLGLILSGHTDTLTEASKLIDKLYKRVATENDLKKSKRSSKFYTMKKELGKKIFGAKSFQLKT